MLDIDNSSNEKRGNAGRRDYDLLDHLEYRIAKLEDALSKIASIKESIAKITIKLHVISAISTAILISILSYFITGGPA